MKKHLKKVLSFILVLTMIVPMFVLPAAADTAVELITSPSGYSNIEVRVTTDKDPLNYSVGDTVTFTMKVYADNKHVSVPMIKYTLEGDGDENHAKVSKSGTLTPDANGVFTLTENVISIPGYMRLEGDIYSADGTTKWAETPDNDRAKALGAGILVDYENITTVSPEPEDFDEVWADRLADLEAVTPNIVRIDKVTKWYSGSTLKTSVSGSDVYAVYVECPGSTGDIIKGDDGLGNEVGATWAVAYLTIPKNKADGSMSIAQGYQGYGINTATPVETSSGIAVNMSTHSLVLLNNDNAATSSEYKSKYTSYIKNGGKYGYDAEDNSAIETCYFANMLLRDLQMLRFAKQAFGSEGAASLITEDTVINGMTKDELLTAMEYWKGLYNGKLTTSGGSQGGFQAIGVGALDLDVASVNANIPWMGDTHTNTDTNKVQGSNRPTVGEGIRYCDTAFLAARVEAPVTITAKLVDKSCVPTGVIAIWNNLVESKKDVDGYMASITWVQSGTHGYTPAYPENPTQILRTYELNEPTGIANNQGGFVESGYTDIDGYTADQDAQPPATGYIQVGTKTQSLATVANGVAPSFYYVEGGNAYYNAELKKLVFVSSSTLKGHYQKYTSTSSQNVNTDGNTWYFEYWAYYNNVNIKEVEFRYGNGGGSFSGIGYVMSILTAAESVKYDNKFANCSWGGQKDASVVVGMTSLKSLGHGTFASDGTFTSSTYKDDIVDLTGFTGIDTSYWKYFLYKCSSVEEVVIPTLAGANMFEGCTMLTKVTIPSSAALTSIGANNFKNCSNLESIDVECNLSSLTVGSAAFSGNAVTVNVKTDADKAIVTNALSAAAITNVTVLSAGEEPPVVEEPEFDEGIAYGEDGYTNSKYSDIDSATSGYVQIGTNDKTKATVTDTFTPKLYYVKNGNTTNGGAYYNPKQEKLVLTIDWGALTGDSQDTKVTSTRNQNISGATWYLAYWVKQNSAAVKEVEFRVLYGTKIAYIGQFMSVFTDTVSVKFDSRITISNNSTSESTGIFTKMTSLKSMGHGSFASNGDFTPTTYEEGKVNVAGFSETTAGNFAYCFNDNTAITAAKTHTLADKNMFDGCSALTTVVVPAGATITSIGASVFDGCSVLETIEILGTVDASIAIDASAFASTGDVNVIVNTLAEKGYFDAALSTAGVTNVTVTAVETDEPDEPDVPVEPEFTDGIANTDADYTKSEYKDIDEGENFVQIGTSSTSKATVTDTFTPKLYYIKNANAYYDPIAEKLVVVSTAGGVSAGAKENQVSTTKNCDTVGAVWYLAYWAEQNSAIIKEVEFRGRWISKLSYIGYFTSVLKNTVSVKFDSKIVNLDGANSANYSLFLNMSSLESAGHVTFNLDGTTVPTTYNEGEVNVTGFTSAPAGALAYCFYNNTSVTSAKTHTLADKNMFDGCSALTTVVIPAGATVTSVGASVFNKCSALETVQILGTVDAVVAIDASAFANTGDVNVIVNTLAEKSYFETALETAGITNVTVTSVETDEPDEPDVPCEPLDVPNAITADGFMVRMKSYTGLRALFSFNESVAQTNKTNDLTLVSYGVIASSYKKFTEDFGGDEDALFAAARKVADSTQSAIKYIPVYNADGTGANRYVDYDKKQFCISFTNISSANALSDIYIAGYVIWEDTEGNLGYTLTTYDMSDGEKAVNLYEITLGLTKTGVINSENTEDICFWQILRNGALKTNSFTSNSSTAGYTLDDGYFTYCDVDWHAYTGNSTTWWSGTKPTGVSSAVSGLVWSVLKYTDDEYVMIYRNKDKSTFTDLQIPMHSVNAQAYAPYDYRYGTVGLTTYNPALTQADYEKIKIIVVDHGVEGMNNGGFSAISKVTTIVYPSEFSAKNQAFYQNTALKNVIWCHTDADGEPVQHLSEFAGITSLVDLRGFTAIGFTETFNGDWPVENIAFGATTSGAASKTFNGVTSLKRAWSAGQSMPASGVLDLSELNITSVGTQTFDSVGKAATIKLPSTITKISGDKALGNGLTADFICNDAVEALIVAYAKGEYASQVANISVNGKSISALIDYYDGIAEMLAPPANGEQPAETLTLQGDTYKLTFFDGFSGTTLDSSKWAKCPEGNRQDLGGKWDDDRAYLDGNGYLVLEAMRDSGGNLTSGAIRTRNKSYSKTFFEQTRGYFECRVKLQSKPGFWSAFWLMASGDYNVGNGATDWAEIDIMESYSVAKKGINHAIHWDGYGDDHQQANAQLTNIDVYDGEFHTFGLLWTETAYIFYIDGIESYRLTEGMSNWPGSCQVSLYLKLTNEFGSWADDMDGTAFTDQVLYDYVRVYAKQ